MNISEHAMSRFYLFHELSIGYFCFVFSVESGGQQSQLGICRVETVSSKESLEVFCLQMPLFVSVNSRKSIMNIEAGPAS